MTDDNVLDPLPVRQPKHHNGIPDIVKDQIIKAAMVEGNMSKIAQEFGVNRNTVASILREVRCELGEITDFQYQRRVESIIDKLLVRLEEGADDLKVSQIPITIGILLDKRRELRGKFNHDTAINLKIAWKDGSGAVELSTAASE